MTGFAEPRVATPVGVKRAADLLAALGHPIRLQIVEGLLVGRADVGAMVTCLGHPQALVSRHLAVLRAAGVVLAVRDGRHRYYRVVHARELRALLRHLPFRTAADTAEEIAS